MAVYQGFGGLLHFGGVVPANTVTVDAVATAGSGNIDLTFTGTHIGCVFVGDVFTVSGEVGSPEHTVTLFSDLVGSQVNVFRVPTTAFATSFAYNIGLADTIAGPLSAGATVALVSPSVANVLSWEVEAELEALDRTVMGDKWRRFVGGRAGWDAACVALLDPDDPRQNAALNALFGATPTTTPAGFTFGTAAEKVALGFGVLHGARIKAEARGLVEVVLAIEGSYATTAGGSPFPALGLFLGNFSTGFETYYSWR